MELRNFIWDLKKKNVEVPLQWSILDKTKPYLPGSRNCRLCLIEKYHILFMGNNLLNERNKLVLKCRHERKYYLSNYKGFSPQYVAKLDVFLFRVWDNYTLPFSFDFKQKAVYSTQFNVSSWNYNTCRNNMYENPLLYARLSLQVVYC